MLLAALIPNLFTFLSSLPPLPCSFITQVLSSPFPPVCEQCGDLNHTVVIAFAVQCGGLISEAPWLFLEVQLHRDWCFIKPFLQLWHFRENKQGLNFPSAGSAHLYLPLHSLQSLPRSPVCYFFLHTLPLNSFSHQCFIKSFTYSFFLYLCPPPVLHVCHCEQKIRKTNRDRSKYKHKHTQKNCSHRHLICNFKSDISENFLKRH